MRLAGTYAEYVVAHESTLLPIPEKTSFHEAAAVPLAAMTAWQVNMTVPHVLLQPTYQALVALNSLHEASWRKTLVVRDLLYSLVSGWLTLLKGSPILCCQVSMLSQLAGCRELHASERQACVGSCWCWWGGQLCHTGELKHMCSTSGAFF